DACGGSRRFITNLEADWLPKLLSGGQQLGPIKTDDRLLSGGAPGTDVVPRLVVRPIVVGADSAGEVKLQAANIGKGRIIYCSGDLTSGLLGINTMGISGYTPPVARAIVKNAILLSESLRAVS